MGPHNGAGKESEEKGMVGTNCYDLTATPIPLNCSGGGGRSVGDEVEPGKKEVAGGRWY